MSKDKIVTIRCKQTTLYLIASHILAFVAGMIACWFMWNH